MEWFFSDRVETALKYIYYDMGTGRPHSVQNRSG